MEVHKSRLDPRLLGVLDVRAVLRLVPILFVVDVRIHQLVVG
jgi:hypothetical protein